jgi:hypothetical protein
MAETVGVMSGVGVRRRLAAIWAFARLRGGHVVPVVPYLSVAAEAGLQWPRVGVAGVDRGSVAVTAALGRSRIPIRVRLADVPASDVVHERVILLPTVVPVQRVGRMGDRQHKSINAELIQRPCVVRATQVMSKASQGVLHGHCLIGR